MDSRDLLRVDRAPRELVGATVLLAIVMIAQLAAAHAFQLFARPFWFDEWVTHLIASDPDPSRAARALSSAIDNNTPILFVLMRAVGWFGSTSPEVAYRCFSFVTVFAGLIGLYLALRQSFTAVVAWTAVLSVWTHPLVLDHAFEARYYGPMFSGAIWFAYLLGRTAQSPSRSIRVVAALAGVFLCTIHYLGVGCMALIVGVELLRRRGTKAITDVLTVSAPGLIALAACMPLLAAQRRALPLSTFLPRPSVGLTWEYLKDLLLPVHLAAVAVLPGIAIIGAEVGLRHRDATTETAPRLDRVAGLASLLLYPVVLIVFSFVVQGVLLVRYALPALAGIGPAVGFVSSGLSRVWLAALCAFFLLSGTRTLRIMEEQELYSEQEMGKLLDALRRDTGDAPITFEIHMPHDLAYYAPDLAPRIYYLGGETPFFKSPEIQTPYYSYSPAGTIWCRSWAQRYASIYGQIQVMPWEKLRRLPRRFIVVGTDPIESFDPPIQEYPGFTLRHVERSLYELVENTP
jgi:hypothetical protein